MFAILYRLLVFYDDSLLGILKMRQNRAITALGGFSVKNNLKIGSLFIIVFLLLVGCNTTNTNTKSQQETAQSNQYPMKIKDALGNSVEITKEPKKIVSLIPSNTETLAAIGVEDRLVGVSDTDDYPASVKKIDKIGGMDFNIEKIISLQPDIVFAHETMAKSTETGMQQLRELGIPVFIVPEAKNFQETYDSIIQMGTIMNHKKEATKVVDQMKKKVVEIEKKVSSVQTKRSAIVETSDEPEIYTAGKSTFIQEIFDMLSIKNSATKTGWYQISSEAIIKSNPDVILVMYDYVPNIVTKVKKRDGFQTISAVKNDRVIQINSDTISRTAPRLVDGLEEVAKAVYPEAFE